MVLCNWNVLVDEIFFSYRTPKTVKIYSPFIGVISVSIKIFILVYVLVYAIIYNKGYQEYSELESVVTSKVKGTVYTNFSDSEFNSAILDTDLYKRIWDPTDYVIPPSEINAIFIATNVVITPKQRQGVCAENPRIRDARCNPNNNTCPIGVHFRHGKGITTGQCIVYKDDVYTCEIQAWCPIDFGIPPLRNIKDSVNDTYLRHCIYNQGFDSECPIFRLSDIVQLSGHNYENIAYKGGVIAVIINWDCNFDRSKEDCFPTYNFHRLDDGFEVAPGFNFRKVYYYADQSRSLYKYYGVKFLFVVQGRGGKFSIYKLFQTFGAGIALFALEIFICDIIILYVSEKRQLYQSKKFESVVYDHDSDDEPIHS